MENLFKKGTSNRTLTDICSMLSILINKEKILRQSVREYMSRLLVDTSKNKPLKCYIVIEDIYIDEKQIVTKIYQDSTNGWIFIKFKESKYYTDFDDLTLIEIVQLLKGLLKFIS